MIGRLPRGRLQVPRLKSYERLGAVITGASSGIGRILALRLAERGAHIALVARREAELEAVAGEIRRLCPGGPDPLILPCDVGVAEQVAAAAERAIAGLGTVDLLVNNAGYGHHRRFLDWDLADMERMMRVNYLGALYWTKALLPKMIERGSGWLVFMASVAGKIGTPEEAAYSASKFAMVGLAEALSLEVEDAGVHVLTVCPGVIRTPFFDQEALARMPPVARRSMVDPEDLVDAILSALARGKHEITYPRAIAAAYAVRGLAPGFMRRQVKRTTLGALVREQRRSSKHRQGNDD
jgi:short-subunit dehydrogenase